MTQIEEQTKRFELKVFYMQERGFPFFKSLVTFAKVIKFLFSFVEVTKLLLLL